MNELLKSIRIYHSMKSGECAEMLDISPSYLSEIESGKKGATLKILNKYSARFGIKTKYFFAFAENKKANMNKLKQFMENQLLLFLRKL